MLKFEKTEDEKVYDRFKSLAKHHLITALHYAEQHKPFTSMCEYGAMCSVVSMYTVITAKTDILFDDDINTLVVKLFGVDFGGVTLNDLYDVVIDKFEEVGENHVTFN